MDINEFKSHILDFNPLAPLQFDGYTSLNDCHRADFKDGKIQIFWFEGKWEVHKHKYSYWSLSSGDTLAEAWEISNLRD